MPRRSVFEMARQEKIKKEEGAEQSSTEKRQEYKPPHPETLERLKEAVENFPVEYRHAIEVALDHEIKNIEKILDNPDATEPDHRILGYYLRELKDLHAEFMKPYNIR